MAKYLISFPSGEMDLSEGDLQAAAHEAHALVREAKVAGVWVFGGGIDEDVPPVLVGADGSVTPGTYPQTQRIEGGYAVLDLPTREDAVAWASRMAAACRCRQELRAFMDDPQA